MEGLPGLFLWCDGKTPECFGQGHGILKRLEMTPFDSSVKNTSLLKQAKLYLKINLKPYK